MQNKEGRASIVETLHRSPSSHAIQTPSSWHIPSSKDKFPILGRTAATFFSLYSKEVTKETMKIEGQAARSSTVVGANWYANFVENVPLLSNFHRGRSTVLKSFETITNPSFSTIMGGSNMVTGEDPCSIPRQNISITKAQRSSWGSGSEQTSSSFPSLIQSSIQNLAKSSFPTSQARPCFKYLYHSTKILQVWEAALNTFHKSTSWIFLYLAPSTWTISFLFEKEVSIQNKLSTTRSSPSKVWGLTLPFL